MKIIKIPVGYLQANCYIINENNMNIVIDPGAEFEKIKKQIHGSISAVLITHNHFDHVGALDKLKNEYKCDIYDFNNLKEQKYRVGLFDFEVIYTPGHTDDSVCYKFMDNIFTGDFLFKESIGRTDLETGNIKKMQNSLQKIVKYKNVNIYPGHGDITTLEYEKANNLFIINLLN